VEEPKKAATPAQLQIIPWIDLSRGELLASGGFGAVYRGQWGWFWNKIEVAIKQPQGRLPDYLKKEFIDEAKIMAECKSPYIVALYGVCVEGNHNDLVMEYVPNGSLDRLLHKKAQEISWNLRFEIAIDIGKGLSYLHDEKNILHKDLKSLNILLDADYHAKICDFGLSQIKIASSTFDHLGKDYTKGTPCWMAPELLKNKASPSKASDIYSYGMILWEIASREKPYKNAVNIEAAKEWIKDGEKEEIPADCPADYGNIVKECWKDEIISLRLMSSIPALFNLPKGNNNVYILVQPVVGMAPTALYFVDRISKATPIITPLNFLPNQNISTFTAALFPSVKDNSYAKIPALLPPQLKAITSITGHIQPKSRPNAKDVVTKLEKTKTNFFKMQQDLPYLSLLLKWVTEGHLIEVEKLLQKNPNLALMKGTVTDLSGRMFKDISAFQYAAWALDIEMCELILKQVDNAGTAEADAQLSELEKNPWGHGSHYDPSLLAEKTQEYLSFNNYTSGDKDKRCQHWQEEVGGEQRKCPAWLIYAWCERGKDVAWVKKDLKNIKVVRQYEKGHLKWWFEQEYNGGKGVGSKWSCERGARELGGAKRSGVGAWGGWWDNTIGEVTHDLGVTQSVSAHCHEVLNSLKTKLSNNTPGKLEENKKDIDETNILSPKSDANNSDLSITISLGKKPPPFTVLFAPPSPQDEETKKDLGLLLKWVTEGHLAKVEELLQKNPNLAFMKESVTDLSGRTFNNISAFQYAAWALDTEMCELILKQVDNADAAVADIQLTELEKNSWKEHGLYYDPSPLAKKTQEYINNSSKWSYEKCCEYWQKEVGGEQRKCPAWLIYAWCEEGKAVAWVKKDLKNIKVVRQYEKGHLKWWFEQEYNGGRGVGSNWSCCRGDGRGRLYNIDIDMLGKWSVKIKNDLETVQYVVSKHEALNSLKLSNNTTEFWLSSFAAGKFTPKK